MAGFITATQFRTPTGYIDTGDGAASSSFPHSYAADIVHPHRPWKSFASITIGDTFYGVDMGSAVTLAAAAIDNTNVTTAVLEAADDDAFTTNLISQIVPIGENLVERSLFVASNGTSYGRLKAFVTLAGTDFAGQSRRYWRWRAGVASVDSSEPKFVVGSAIWCRAITTWTSGTPAYDELPLEATRPNDDYAGGGRDPVIVGNPHGAVTLSGAPMDRDAMRADILRVLRRGLGRPFLFFKNDSDTADFYVCYRAADTHLKQTAPLLMELSDLIAESAV